MPGWRDGPETGRVRERLMPRMYRVMMKDADGKPAIADDAGLGVRDGEVRIDRATGCVRIEPNKGMSVYRRWQDISPHRRPERLGNGGLGDDDTYCFRLGQEGWASGPVVPDQLDLSVGAGRDPNHGVVRPVQQVSLADFRTLLADTREGWVVDEEP